MKKKKYIQPSEIDGKRLALLVVGEDSKGESESAVFAGIAQFDGTTLVLDRGESHLPFVVPDYKLNEIQNTPKSVRKILLGCNYYIRFGIGPIPEGDDISEYEKTGLHWPD
jgi:hypothetical protein